jgi:hypothetical protein
MGSSNKDKAAAASAEIPDPGFPENRPTDRPVSEVAKQEDDDYGFDDTEDADDPAEAVADGTGSVAATSLVPADFDLNDFDDEFDDDFEAETAGEYELEDDEYARALMDIVDFEIEGLEAYRDDE